MYCLEKIVAKTVKLRLGLYFCMCSILMSNEYKLFFFVFVLAKRFNLKTFRKKNSFFFFFFAHFEAMADGLL